MKQLKGKPAFLTGALLKGKIGSMGEPVQNWVPLSWRLNADWAEWAKQVWPQLYVNQSKITNKVSTKDPLGALPALIFDHDSDNQLVRMTLHGEQTPWLDPQALETYALIQWPDTFRRGKNGQAPE